jgi:hypothetical protein
MLEYAAEWMLFARKQRIISTDEVITVVTYLYTGA